MQKSAMIVYEERRDDDTHPSLGKPFRVQAKLRNNRMINARKMMGFETITSAANAIGIPVGSLCDLEGFKDSPWSKRNGTWNRNAIRIAAFYQQLPEDLWPEVVAQVDQTYAELEVGVAALALSPQPDDPIALIESRERAEQLRACVESLPPRHQKVIRARFGLDDGNDQTLEDVSAIIDVSRERGRQIEAKALRTLRKNLARRKDELT